MQIILFIVINTYIHNIKITDCNNQVVLLLICFILVQK